MNLLPNFAALPPFLQQNNTFTMIQDPLPYSLPIGSTREWHGCTLTLTEEGWRAEVKHSMHRRCKGWDYCRPCTYMVTVNTQHHDTPPTPSIPNYRLPEWLAKAYAKSGHPHLFGELGKVLNNEGKAEIVLNELGKAVEACIMDIPKYHPEVSILDHIVMPNHVHFIIKVHHLLPPKKPLGEIVKGFKAGVSHKFKELALGISPATPVTIKSSQTVSEKTLISRQKYGGHGHKNPTTGLVFEPGFHDRILFRPNQLQTLINYVHDNPQRLWSIVHNRQYFEKTAGWRITMPLLPQGGSNNVGRWWNYYPGGAQALSSNGGARGLLDKVEISQSHSEEYEHELSTITMTFNAIGNRELLKAPERMQIQCSRKMTDEAINCLINDVLEACNHGVVIVSPCISPGEKRVARAVMDAGHQLIVLFPNGIPPQTNEYKPYGTYFSACARGQLLILSPWEFYAGREHITRWQCLMLNDIAAQLSL